MTATASWTDGRRIRPVGAASRGGLCCGNADTHPTHIAHIAHSVSRQQSCGSAIACRAHGPASRRVLLGGEDSPRLICRRRPACAPQVPTPPTRRRRWRRWRPRRARFGPGWRRRGARGLARRRCWWACGDGTAVLVGGLSALRSRRPCDSACGWRCHGRRAGEWLFSSSLSCTAGCMRDL